MIKLKLFARCYLWPPDALADPARLINELGIPHTVLSDGELPADDQRQPFYWQGIVVEVADAPTALTLRRRLERYYPYLHIIEG